MAEEQKEFWNNVKAQLKNRKNPVVISWEEKCAVIEQEEMEEILKVILAEQFKTGFIPFIQVSDNGNIEWFSCPIKRS